MINESKSEENGNDATEKVLEQTSPQVRRFLEPKCPNPECGADPIVLIGKTYPMRPAHVLVAFCSKCRNPVPAMLMTLDEPEIALARGRIVS